MEHLEFTNKLHELGVSYKGNMENKIKIIHTYYTTPNNSDVRIVRIKDLTVEIKNFICKYKENNPPTEESALNVVIRRAINMGEFNLNGIEISQDNYECIMGIIQDKILKRAEDIDFLLTVYFLIRKEISKDK